MRFGVLGTLRVQGGDAQVDLRGARQRRLLALMLVHANRVVSTDTILNELWDDPTSGAVPDRRKALWVIVSRLRTALEPDRPARSGGTILLTRPPGYLLSVESGDLDALRFEALANEGRAVLDSDAPEAALRLSEALALWRGPAFEEFAYDSFAADEIRRLAEMRLACLENRIDADLCIGRSHELVAELEDLVGKHPLRQRMVGHLMVALYRAGRQAEALRAFVTFRRHLGDELGLDPSSELVELDRRLLADDPSLHGPQSVRLASGRAEPGLAVRGYELLKTIGNGSSGRVFVAEQVSAGRQVAIKSIRPDRAGDPGFIRRFDDEARLVASFDHPNVVPVYDYWREPDSAYLVMRLFEHGSLADRLALGPLERGAALDVISQVGRAVVAAHDRGLVHGDIKPANVLLDGDGVAHVSDFGGSFGPADDGRSGEYLAPERSSTNDGTTLGDVYSLGALASTLLFTDGVPHGDAIEHAMHPDPARRCATAAEFLERITDSTAEPVSAPTTIDRFDSSPNSSGGRRRLVTAVLAVAVLVTAGVVGAWVLRSPDDARRLNRATDLTRASERARSLGDSDLAVLYAVMAVRQTVPLGSATAAAVDATHWALQDLGAPYPVGSNAEGVIRAGPDGPTGVFLMTARDLVAHAESVVVRKLTDAECVDVWPDAAGCPEQVSIPASLPIDGYDAVVVGDRPFAGTTVSFTDFALALQPGLGAELAAFTEATGIKVDLAENTTPADFSRLSAGDLTRPDVFAATGPVIPQWARDQAIDIGRFIDPEVLRGDFGSYLLQRPAAAPAEVPAPVSGPVLAIPIDLDVKGLVFYPKAAFAAAGYEVPEDWSSLIELSRTIVADGGNPWCMSFGAGGLFDGFPGTDLLDSLVVRAGGLDTFDAWVNGRIGFTDPAVLEAGRVAEELIGEPGFVRGGRRSISSNQFSDDMLYLLRRDPTSGVLDPECWLLHQGYFMFGLAGPEAVVGTDLDAFLLPPFDGDDTPPLVVNGTFASGLVDRPEVRAFLSHLASPEWGEVMAATTGSGFLPANRRFDATAFDTDDPGTGPALESLRFIAEAIVDDRLRLDGSGLMPPSIGFVDQGEPGSLFRGMVDWADQRRTIELVFADIDADWTALGSG